MKNENFENFNIKLTSQKADNNSILQCCQNWTKKDVLNYVDDIDCAELLLTYLTDPLHVAQENNVKFWFDS